MTRSASSVTLEAAEKVSEILEGLGIPTALIGGVALAVHGYVRATQDLDLATSVDVHRDLRRARDVLADHGFEVELREPDADDPLGGVLDVRAPGTDLIQVVNYLNPWNGAAAVGQEAVQTAQRLGDLKLRVVDLGHLIALKLYAGGARQLADVLELLSRHPEVDLEELGHLCARLELAAEWGATLKALPR